MKCAIDSCDKEAKVRGWCAGHYTKWQRHGDPLYKKAHKKDEKCTAPECERAQKAKGYCNTHYRKVHRTGTLENLNFTPEWKKKNGEARWTELTQADPTPDPRRNGYLATNTVSEIRYKAQKRGIQWTLTALEAYKLITSDCNYCGIKAGWPESRNGIDRVDNYIGYRPDNCVAACARCNSAKLDGTLEDFVSWIKAIAARLS